MADRSARALDGAAAVPSWSLGVVAVGAVLAYAAVLAVAEAERFDGARRRAADAALARLPRKQDINPKPTSFETGKRGRKWAVMEAEGSDDSSTRSSAKGFGRGPLGWSV